MPAFFCILADGGGLGDNGIEDCGNADYSGRGNVMDMPTLLPGTLIKRYKRFFADIRLDNGAEIIAHCPNTGAMTGCVTPGWRVWVSESDNPKRKLRYTLELVESPSGMICVHSARANKLVAEALTNDVVGILDRFDSIRAEVKYGAGSRADFLLTRGDEQLFLEVKAVTLHAGGGLGQFPDAVSDRARRHVDELVDVVASGQRGAMLFCALHESIDRVEPAVHIDARYCRALGEAVGAGVEVYAVGTQITPHNIVVSSMIPVVGLNDGV